MGSIGLTGEVDVGPVRGEGKLGNMSPGVMKKLGSVPGKRAVLEEVHGVGAKHELCWIGYRNCEQAHSHMRAVSATKIVIDTNPLWE